MTVTLSLNVTAAHIRDGVAKNCHYCPVALALLEAARVAWPAQNDLNVSVNGTELRVWSTSVDSPFLFGTCTDDTLRRFIYRYDDGEVVYPLATDVVLQELRR
jgi:hypothetical protein